MTPVSHSSPLPHSVHICVHDQERVLLTHLLQEKQITSNLPTSHHIKDGEWQSQR